jgi:NADPH2:quinone reductase
VFVTAHDAMATIAGVREGEVLLVHAAGSGVGTAVVQLAHAWGCRVVGTARSADKLERCRGLGLDHGVLASRPLDPTALADEIVAAAGPVDVTIDLVGGDYLRADVRVAALHGRIVVVGTLAGSRSELDLGAVLGKRLRIVGTTLRSRGLREKADAMTAFGRDVLPLLASGAVTMPFDDAQQAYDLLASDTVFGKVVLVPA